jgi:hypothetical protein
MSPDPPHEHRLHQGKDFLCHYCVAGAGRPACFTIKEAVAAAEVPWVVKGADPPGNPREW